ncbi:hypothetical protein DSAG12_00036 [Promethearchaeum syntrophicum]|uniref:Uncharacterized protein n=1 Tax=Promethearchaeum syntrophicum TaxID=2594042 RepID=A0A5B9D5B4_9ARCH|nr:hypothetical protein [Candidatus Prometheoarchaeum syntrophicum]QEE14225.1 hypothetical protein DSAG12_00036 [Candidatus Prometheoarchaeum syntrophicum]
MDPKKKHPLKYKLKLIVNQHRIGTKPYILNTLGNLCQGFLSELKDVPKNEKINILIVPNSKEDEKVKIFSPSETIPIQIFVQDLIMKTLLGFISTLEGIPDDLENSETKIMIEPK